MAFPKPHTGFILEPNKGSRQQRPMVSRLVPAETHRLGDRLPSMGTLWVFNTCTHLLPYLSVSAATLSHGLRSCSYCHASDTLVLPKAGGQKAFMVTCASILALVQTYCTWTSYVLKTILES